MKRKQFDAYMVRDGSCVHCGQTEAVSLHHRANRGMGGSSRRENAANLVVMCSLFNGLMESDERSASLARLCGWKLRPWESPTETPLWHFESQTWRQLLDDGTFTTVDTYHPPDELLEYF